MVDLLLRMAEPLNQLQPALLLDLDRVLHKVIDHALLLHVERLIHLIVVVALAYQLPICLFLASELFNLLHPLVSESYRACSWLRLFPEDG